MEIVIFAIIAANVWTLVKYFDFRLIPTTHRVKAAFDFIGPVGSIAGRILCGFKITENFGIVIMGIIFNCCILIMAYGLTI